MMEVSKQLQADIKNIQNQLKSAIQNHQLVVLKMRSDPLNVQMKVQLLGHQKHILLLGDKQKSLFQQLRKELEANSTNSTIKSMPIRPSSVSSTSSSNTSEDSEDSQRDREEVVTKCSSDPSYTTKLQFMKTIGLVTREALFELQNRRVERKRRSTANHKQFVYGNWDVSKRKKSSYLASSGTTAPLRRSLRVESSTDSTETLRIPGLPASLTIERVKMQVCAMCRKTGSQLNVCNSCSIEYHVACSPHCPRCNVKQEVPKPDLKERETERQRLLGLNQELNGEKDELERRAAELSAALAAQEANRKSLLQSEEATRRSIQRLQDFVTIIKSAPS